MRYIAIMVLVMLIAHPLAYARTLAEVNVPESVTQEGHGKELLLNGAGIRKKFFIKVYVAGLYLPEKTSEAAVVESMDGANRLLMHFVYSEVSRKKMDTAWQEGFYANNSKETMAGLADSLALFKSFFPDMHEGDVVWIDYLPGRGTFVTINGEEKGYIPGREFNIALLRVWLGPNPVTDELKSGLLGLE